MEFMHVTIKWMSGDTRTFRMTHTQYCEFTQDIDIYYEEPDGNAPFVQLTYYVNKHVDDCGPFEQAEIQINCLYIMSIEFDRLPSHIQKYYKKAE